MFLFLFKNVIISYGIRYWLIIFNWPQTQQPKQKSPQTDVVGDGYSPLGALYNMRPPNLQQQQQEERAPSQHHHHQAGVTSEVSSSTNLSFPSSGSNISVGHIMAKDRDKGWSSERVAATSLPSGQSLLSSFLRLWCAFIRIGQQQQQKTYTLGFFFRWFFCCCAVETRFCENNYPHVFLQSDDRQSRSSDFNKGVFSKERRCIQEEEGMKRIKEKEKKKKKKKRRKVHWPKLLCV